MRYLALATDYDETLADEGRVRPEVVAHSSGTGVPISGPFWIELSEPIDAWTADALARRDVDALLDYETKGPATRIALPTREHFVPLLVNLGAAADGEKIEFPITGFWMGSLARRSVQFG